MKNAYQEGIQARKDKVGPHENPYFGVEVGFVDYLFNPRIHGNIANAATDWSRGWQAEDRWQQQLKR